MIRWKRIRSGLFSPFYLTLATVELREFENLEKNVRSHFHLVNDMDVEDTFHFPRHSLFMNITFEDPFVFAFGKIDPTAVKNLTETFRMDQLNIAKELDSELFDRYIDTAKFEEMRFEEPFQIKLPPQKQGRVVLHRKSFHKKFRATFTFEYRDEKKSWAEMTDDGKFLIEVPSTIEAKGQTTEFGKVDLGEIQSKQFENLQFTLGPLNSGQFSDGQTQAFLIIDGDSESKFSVPEFRLKTKLDFKDSSKFKIAVGRDAITRWLDSLPKMRRMGVGTAIELLNEMQNKMKGGLIREFDFKSKKEMKKKASLVLVSPHHQKLKTNVTLESERGNTDAFGPFPDLKFVVRINGMVESHAEFSKDYELKQSELNNLLYSLRDVQMTQVDSHQSQKTSKIHLINQRRVNTSFSLPQFDLDVKFTFGDLVNFDMKTDEEVLKNLVKNIPGIKKRVEFVSSKLASELKHGLPRKIKIKNETRVQVAGGKYLEVTLSTELYYSKFKSVLTLALEDGPKRVLGWLNKSVSQVLTQITGSIELKAKTTLVRLGEHNNLYYALN